MYNIVLSVVCVRMCGLAWSGVQYCVAMVSVVVYINSLQCMCVYT